MQTIALAMTVKNEGALLLSNIAYHRYMGVDHIYLFLDDGDKDSLTAKHELESVTVMPSIAVDQLSASDQLSAALQAAREQRDYHHCARQILNCTWALRSAEQAGYDWLISIDADELVCPLGISAQNGALRTFLDTIPAAAKQVILRPLEVAPRKFEYANVFEEESLFINGFRRDGKRWSRRNDVNRSIYDPLQDTLLNPGAYLGHYQGKALVRTSAAAVPASVHHFIASDGAALPTMENLGLLHYPQYSYSDFLKKYRNMAELPPNWVNGSPVPYIPYGLWRTMVNSGDFTADYLQDYFRRWVLISSAELDRLAEHKPPILARCTVPQLVFKALVAQRSRTLAANS